MSVAPIIPGRTMAATAPRPEAAPQNGASKPKHTVYRAVDLVPRIVAGANAPRVETPFVKLNKRLGGGFHLHTVTAIISGVGLGKTALGLQIAAHHAETGPALYYGLELTPEQLAARVIAQRTGLAWREVLGGGIDAVQMHEVLAPLNLYLMARAPDPIAAIAEGLETAMASVEGVPMLVVDYIQLLADIVQARGDMRVATMTAVWGLHRLTEGRPMVTVAISQSSRSGARAIAEATGDASDLVGAGAETAAIEASAANELVLAFTKKDDADQHSVTVNVAKARFGATGKVGFAFHGPSGTWTESDEVPVTPATLERRQQILESLRLADGPLSKNKIRARDDERTGKEKQYVKGSKAVVNAEIEEMVRLRMLRESGGAFWLGERVPPPDGSEV